MNTMNLNVAHFLSNDNNGLLLKLTLVGFLLARWEPGGSPVGARWEPGGSPVGTQYCLHYGV